MSLVAIWASPSMNCLFRPVPSFPLGVPPPFSTQVGTSISGFANLGNIVFLQDTFVHFFSDALFAFHSLMPKGEVCLPYFQVLCLGEHLRIFPMDLLPLACIQHPHFSNTRERSMSVSLCSVTGAMQESSSLIPWQLCEGGLIMLEWQKRNWGT